MTQTTPKQNAGELIVAQLRNPLKLRLALCLTVVAAWYFLFLTPLADKTDTTAARVGRERKRIATARAIESLQKDLATQQALTPAGANLNELMRHVIDRLRSSPLKLIDLKPESSKDVGPYEAIGVQVALEGRFGELNAFLTWIENDVRQFRVDSIKIDPNHQDPSRLKTQITLLCLAEKPPPVAKPEPGKSQAAKKTPE